MATLSSLFAHQKICPQTLVQPVIEARKPPRHRRRPFRVAQLLHDPEV
jgi:hypothetical protein